MYIYMMHVDALKCFLMIGWTIPGLPRPPTP